MREAISSQSFLFLGIGNTVRSEELGMRSEGAMHNSYSIASIDKWAEAVALYLPIGGGAEGGGGSTSGKKSYVGLS